MPYASRKQQTVKDGINFLDISRGECTVFPRGSIPAGYGEAVINFRLTGVPQRRSSDPTSIGVTRPGLSKLINLPLPSSQIPRAVARTINEQVVASPEALYRVDASGEPELIHVIEAAENEVFPWLMNAEGMLLVCDGGYLKYWDETDFNICYDVTGYEFDYRSDGDSGIIALYSGSTTRAAQTETTPAWTTGLTIPTGPAIVTLSKVGSPSGELYLKVYDSSKTLLATSNALAVSGLTGTGVDYNITFSTAYLRSRSTVFTYSLEYEAGDASNYVRVHYNAVTSGGGVETYNGSWLTDYTKNLLMGLRPSVPPKGRWAQMWNRRFLVGGSPDYGSYLNYCNLPDSSNPGGAGIFDWGAGELNGANAGVIPVDPGDGADITGIVRAFGGLLIFKGPKPARIYILSGTQPADWVLEEKIPDVSTSAGHGLVAAANTVFFFDHERGQVHDISGVEAYHDVQYKPISWPIANQLSADSRSFAAAYGADDQLWFFAHGNDYVNVYHPLSRGWTRYRFGNGADNSWQDCRWTWGEWGWPWENDMYINPAMFCKNGDALYLCADNGFVYQVDQDQVKDDILKPEYVLLGRPECLEVEHSIKQAKRLTFQISGLGTIKATGKLGFRKNLNTSYFKSLEFILPMSGQTWADCTMRWIDYDWSWTGEGLNVPRRKRLNFNYRYLQAGIEDLGVLSSPLQVDRVLVRSAVLGDH